MVAAIYRSPASKRRPNTGPRRAGGRAPALRSHLPQPASAPWSAQIDRLQHGFKLTQLEFAAQLIQSAPRSVILWKNGRRPNAAVRVRLQELDRLYAALAHLMPPRDVGPWMKQTNDYLDPLTPLEVIARGQIDRLWHIIHNVATGMPV
jgi:hypothetical protein